MYDVLHAKQHIIHMYSHQLQLQEWRMHQKCYLATGFTFLHFEYEKECFNRPQAPTWPTEFKFFRIPNFPTLWKFNKNGISTEKNLNKIII